MSLLAAGDPNGHADPFGARAAGQARAGKVLDSSMIVQPANERQRVEVGDYVLANDRIAVYIEDKDLSSGYARFGGEILSVDAVGEDGRPLGLSRYGETLLALSNEMIDPESVTVLADGSDGGDAVVRVLGRLEAIPFLKGSLGVLFPREYRMPAALDYVLAPGSERLAMRLHFVNETHEPMDLKYDEMYGFFHYNRSQMVTAEYGYEEPKKSVAWVGFDGGALSFAWRTPGEPLSYVLTESGFSDFTGDGFAVDACSMVEREHAEIIAGGPELDGLREAIRRVDGEPAWRQIAGKVLEADGTPAAGAWVVETDDAGTLLSRTRSGDDGSYVLHAPDQAVHLTPYLLGRPSHDAVAVGAGEAQADLTFAAYGTIRVSARDSATQQPVPARIEVFPSAPPAGLPARFGIEQGSGGKLYQQFSADGTATLAVPPGEHRVLVSHGPFWEYVDTTVNVAAGQTVDVAAPLARAVDQGHWLCADFHEHTWFSADSTDPVQYKVAGGVADGLQIPTFSDHEWVTDPQPSVEALGLSSVAHGLTSLELTTFSWGHFGVIPMTARPEEPNGGAVEWVGKDPADVFALVDALPEKPLLIVNHPRGGGFGAYFDSTAYNRGTGQAGPLFSDNFDAIEICNGSSFEHNRDASVADWFSFLDRGRNVWAVGGSDNHSLRSGPVGYPRTCMYFDDPNPVALTPTTIRDALASGAAFVSGGLWLDVRGPTGERLGQTATASGTTATFTVAVMGSSWVPADSLELIVNGKTVETRTLPAAVPGSPRHDTEVFEVPIDTSAARTWVVFHASGAGDMSPIFKGRSPFAVSNPVFVTAGR